MEEKYQYTEVNECLKEFAKTELNENPDKVNAHIESFRRWVKSMPHIKCPTDSKFLLRFLRVAKFDHEKAEKRLDNFCTMRTSIRGLPSYFKYYPIDHPKVKTFLNMKFLLPLGRSDNGELFVLFRTRNWNPDTFDLMSLINMILMSVDVLLYEEEVQVYGISQIMDLEKVRFSAIEKFSQPKLIKNLYKLSQESAPMRIRTQIYFKESLLCDFVLKIVLFFAKKKIAERIYRIGDDIGKVINMKPGLKKVLPIEYNGLGGTIDECAERWKERFEKFYENRNSFQDISVDESKRPKKTLGYLKEYPDFSEETLGASGTYTKFANAL